MTEEREAARVSVMSTDHGRIVLSTPSKLTEADVADFEAWVALVIRGMRRRALAASSADGGEHET